MQETFLLIAFIWFISQLMSLAAAFTVKPLPWIVKILFAIIIISSIVIGSLILLAFWRSQWGI